MKIFIILIVSMILTDNRIEFNQIKGIIVKKQAFQINTYKFENMYQYDYLLEVPFQYNTFKDSDLKLLNQQGWELCKSESFDWQEYKDISGVTPKWRSNRLFRFYKGKSKHLALMLMYRANSKLEVKESKVQKIVITIVYLSEVQIQQIEKDGLSVGCST